MKISSVSYNCNYKLGINRYYNPRISQFYATDPLAEKYPNFSPYTYTADNPVMLVDPNGKCVTKNSNGKFIPCPKQKIGTTKKGYFGFKWIYTDTGWKLKNGNTNQQAKKCAKYVPVQPDGSANYYIERYLQHINQYHTKPPDYLLLYGYNNRAINFEKIYKYLTPIGQVWFNDVAKGLQQMIEKKLKDNPEIELNSHEFTEFAFDSHPSVYLQDGLMKYLPYKDLVLIGIAPGKDIFSYNGLKQILSIVPKLPQSHRIYHIVNGTETYKMLLGGSDYFIKTFNNANIIFY